MSALIGLYSPATGIIDSHQLLSVLEHGAKLKGATIAYECEVTAAARTATGYTIEVREPDRGNVRPEECLPGQFSGL